MAAPFDILLDQLLTLAAGSPGLIVSCSDVLLVLPDTIKLSGFGRATGLAIRADAATYGPYHGVYLLNEESSLCRTFLQKPSLQELEAEQAIDRYGKCCLDSGVIFFDAMTSQTLANLALSHETISLVVNDKKYPNDKNNRPPRIELYSDILRAFSGGGFFEIDEYLAMPADEPDANIVSIFRHALWTALHHIQLGAVCPPKAYFKHLGTSREFLQLCVDDDDSSHFRTYFDLRRSVHANMPLITPASCVCVNSQLSGIAPQSLLSEQSLLEHSILTGHCEIGPRCIVSALRSCNGLHLPQGIVIQQLELLHGLGFVCFILGIDDDVKACYPHGTYLNKKWEYYNVEKYLWPQSLPSEKRTLWTARLYVPKPTAQASLLEAMRLVAHGPAPMDNALSLQDIVNKANNQAEFEWRLMLERQEDLRRLQLPSVEISEKRLSRIAARYENDSPIFMQCISKLCDLFEHTVRGGEPVHVISDDDSIKDALATRLEDICLIAIAENDFPLAARAAAVIAEIYSQLSTDEQVILFNDTEPEAILHDLRKVRREHPNTRHHQQNYEALSAAIVRQAVVRSFSNNTKRHTPTKTVSVRSTAPARIDFGGGWSDTPPIAYELNGAAVTNAAIRIDGKRSIGCDVSLTQGQGDVILCVARGQDLESSKIVLKTVADLADRRSPNAPAALLKCCLKLRLGILDEDPTTPLLQPPLMNYQLEVRSWSTSIPQGSGLGTSSILAACVLTALDAALSGGNLTTEAIDRKQLVNDVLLVEQDLTTGGGFQDNAGGIYPGIKICSAAPGLPLRISVEPLTSSSNLARHLLLVYTGAVRLAKNLLMSVIRRWHSRSPVVVAAFEALPKNARAAADACLSSSAKELGQVLDDYWHLKKQVTGGSSSVEPVRVRQIIDTLRPLIHGASLCGAGGGGFLLIVTKEPDAIGACEEALSLSHFSTCDIHVSTVEFDHTGIDVFLL
uniref:GHMP kinase N-terminal domain-containing protein n=1 Tax=Aureoumbra lagunensis TaxID=44058 RepID=A0A7S3K7D6_9STRA